MTFNHISNNFLIPSIARLSSTIETNINKTYFQTLLHCTLKQHYSFSNPEKIA